MGVEQAVRRVITFRHWARRGREYSAGSVGHEGGKRDREKERGERREKKGERERRGRFTRIHARTRRGTIHETGDGVVRVPGARRCVRVAGVWVSRGGHLSSEVCADSITREREPNGTNAQR